MPRPEVIAAALEALLANLSGFPEVLFQANTTRTSARVSIGAVGLVVLSKLSFTTGYYSNISYDIEIRHASLAAARHLSVYVRHPSLTNLVANQKAMANALEYLRYSEDTIHCRDVDARDFEAA
ncbi:hypothetical protein C8Q73DRAFT_795462 [Cubamyces lactineus]|nr:hypothetical protein C8Q73DRAFT_795462 [Cubamyces lactineus]